jgi:hypothetical protein
MSALDALNAEFHVLLGKVEALGHTGLDELHAVWAKVTGQATKDATALAREAETDAAQVTHDAQAAMGPVLAEAEKDAAKVGAKAVADVEAAVQPPASA